MKIAAIIAEYNPFHNGHKYQLDKARELLGEDTAIIAVMSGNYTQRGEIAIADKTVRAKAAVDSGVNLVLELPFPYSMSSAEFFASAGVHIVNSLGVVDYLVFGSESGDADKLSLVADAMLSSEFSNILSELSENDEYKNSGYPTLCEEAYKKLTGCSASELFAPNNILAFEYIKALKRENSKITPIAIKREGAGYSSEDILDTPFQSATAIRRLLENECNSAYEYIPKSARSAFEAAKLQGKFPADISKLDSAIISFFRLNSSAREANFHDAGGGLYNRLCDMSAEATSISSLTSMTETKKYTKARIRRAILYSYLGVTSSDVRTLPRYTQVLALDGVGRLLLKRIKKVNGIKVFTKPSAYRDSESDIISQKELSHRADAVYGLTQKNAYSGRFPITFTPYVKK